jgi:hypothetical protein
MTERAEIFVNGWVVQHVEAEGYQLDGDFTMAQGLAEQCIAAAHVAGLSESEIEDEFPDLVSHMASEIEEANDRAVALLAEDDE